MEHLFYSREKPTHLPGNLAAGSDQEIIPIPSGDDAGKRIHVVIGEFFATTIEEGTMQFKQDDGVNPPDLIEKPKMFNIGYIMQYRRIVIDRGFALTADVTHPGGLNYDIWYWLDK